MIKEIMIGLVICLLEPALVIGITWFVLTIRKNMKEEEI